MLKAIDPSSSSTKYPRQEERSVLTEVWILSAQLGPDCPQYRPPHQYQGHHQEESAILIMRTLALWCLQWALQWLKTTSLRRIQQVWRHHCDACSSSFCLTLTWLSEAPLKDKRYIALQLLLWLRFKEYEFKSISIFKWKGEPGEVRSVSGGWVLMTDDAWVVNLAPDYAEKVYLVLRT